MVVHKVHECDVPERRVLNVIKIHMCVASGFDTFAFSILGRVEVGLMGRLMVIVVVATQYDFLSEIGRAHV